VTEQQFWQLIAELDGSCDDDAFDRLADRLVERGVEDILGFADRLADVLHRIDLRRLADQPFRDAEAPTGPPVNGSDDAFLYARCAVVIAGRGTVEAVLDDATAFARPWDLSAEALLTVAPSAYERATGHDWQHESPTSYETGANFPGWHPEWSR
jgi:Protein of unknown function (DUF4240)